MGGNPFLLGDFPRGMPPLRGGTLDGEQQREQHRRPGGLTLWLVTTTSTRAGVGAPCYLATGSAAIQKPAQDTGQ